jgi:GR25 family glycosyltransferase involved in LPS biosynthesis
MEFPPIIVINLDERPDRWAEIQKEFVGWPTLERLSAVKDSPGWKGCNKSHVKALEEAKKRGYPWVLVLEDDCMLTSANDSLKRFTEFLPSLWNRRGEYDVFLGGCTQLKDVSVFQFNPQLFRMKGYTTHFCLYPASSYDKLINGIRNSTIVIDKFFMNDPSIRLICTTPHIAIQRPGKSDLVEQETNYHSLFLSSEEVLTKFQISEKSLEGFLQESKVYNNKLSIANILMIAFIFAAAKRLLAPL